MSYGSPRDHAHMGYSGTPLGNHGGYAQPFASPSPTPSPHGNFFQGDFTPQRPSTRTHSRHVSSGGVPDFRPATAFSPRYRSDGVYGTMPDGKVSSSRKHSFSKGSKGPSLHKRERRSSYTYVRTPYGDPDGAWIEMNGVPYPLRSGGRYEYGDEFFYRNDARHGTDHHYSMQGGLYQQQQQQQFFEKEPPMATPPRQEQQVPQRSATRLQHSRRSSQSMPQRPSSARPSSSHQKQPRQAPRATKADAAKYRIPEGFSLKNWDPTEEPLILLGSVFDANALGKWIYDWTVYRHGAGSPIGDLAGELWLLLIQLSGKLRRAEEVAPQVRTKENRAMIDEFIGSGERLIDKLQALLRRCEAPMLKAAKKKGSTTLDSNSGVEFVNTLFGRERELPHTETFMQRVRLWILRFDANCENILKHPTM